MTTSATAADILRERAEALAAPPNEAIAESERIEIVEFRIGSDSYGLPLGAVREVAPLQHFTPIPSTPAWVLGLMNLRGEIIVIVDLRHLFNLPGRGLSDLNHVLVLHTAEMDLGILADDILGTCSIPLAGLASPHSSAGAIDAAYLRGVSGTGVKVLEAALLSTHPGLLVRHVPEKNRVP
jgi:purine-binding chemotaxis protein CheW